MAREVTFLVMKNEFLSENQRLKCPAESLAAVENFIQTKLELLYEVAIKMQVAEGVFAAVTSVDELPDKIRVQISPKAAGPVSFTLLIMQNDLVLQNRKVTASAADAAELLEAVAEECGISSDNVILTSDGQDLANYDFAELPHKLRVKLEASKPVVGAAREFLLFVAAADGINANPRRCKVEAATLAELCIKLEQQLEVAFAIEVLLDGALVVDLAALPAKAKVSVAKGASSQRFQLTVSSDDLFEGTRECTVRAETIDELAAAVQESLGLSCEVEILHKDPDFGAVVKILDLEDLQSLDAIVVAPCSSGRTAGGSAYSRSGPKLADSRAAAEGPPAPPLAPSLVVATDQTLQIGWPAPPSSSPVQGYKIERQSAGSDEWLSMGILIRESNAICNELDVVSEYRFRVTAYNASGASEAGEESELLATKAGKPDAPDAPSCDTKTDTTISLSWSAPEDNGGEVQSYEILYKPADVEGAAYKLAGTSEATEFVATGLLPVHDYVFAVAAINEAGKSPVGAETEAISTEPGPPTAPSGVSLHQTPSPFSLAISWTASNENGSAVNVYNVEKMAAGSDEDWEAVGAVRATAGQTFSCVDLRPSTGYVFKVSASNAIGVSEYSAVSAVFTTEAAPPEQPDPPILANATAAALTVEWEAPDDHGTPIHEYCVEQLLGSYDPESSDKWAVVGQDSATTLTVGGMAPATSFYFRVTAISTVGSSQTSAVAGRFQTRAAAPSRPFPPSPTQETITSSSISLSWVPPDDNGSRITSYRLECSEHVEGSHPSWTTAAEGPEPTGEAMGLRPATDYRFRVIAANAEGDSSNGEEATARTEADRPDAPEPPMLTGNNPTTMQLSWSAPRDNGGAIEEYQLQRAIIGGDDDDDWETVATVPGTSAEVAKGKEAETVCFRVLASNSAGWSEPSESGEEIAAEASMAQFTLLVRSELFTDKRKVVLTAGSINHLNTEVAAKLKDLPADGQFQLFTDAGALLTSLDQLKPKDKIELRPIRTSNSGGGAGGGPPKRKLNLLVESPLFEDKRRCTVEAGDLAELISGLQQKLVIATDIVVVIYDEDFEEHR